MPRSSCTGTVSNNLKDLARILADLLVRTLLGIIQRILADWLLSRIVDAFVVARVVKCVPAVHTET